MHNSSQGVEDDTTQSKQHSMTEKEREEETPLLSAFYSLHTLITNTDRLSVPQNQLLTLRVTCDEGISSTLPVPVLYDFIVLSLWIFLS